MLAKGTPKKSDTLLLRLGILIVVAGCVTIFFSEVVLRSAPEKHVRGSARKEGRATSSNVRQREGEDGGREEATVMNAEQLQTRKRAENDKFLADMSQLELKLSNESVVWPTLFVLGAAKSASSTFHDLLVQHSQLCTARSSHPGRAAKEVGILFATKIKVFLLSLYGRAPGGHDQRCQELAQNRSATFWYMDNHPIYLSGFEKTMKAMIPAHLHPQLRFLVVLREPLARSISQFNHQRARDCEWWCDAGVLDSAHFAAGFHAGPDYVARSLYAQQLEPWFRAFDRQQFLVLNTQHLLARTADAMTRVASFLAIDPRPWQRIPPIAIASPASPAPPRPGSSSSSSGGAAEDDKRGRRISAWEFGCAELEGFARLFAPHNHALYRLLAATKSRAPSQEPPFEPFPDPRYDHTPAPVAP